MNITPGNGQSTPLWRVFREHGATPADLLRAFGLGQPPIDVGGLARALGVVLEEVPNPGWSGAVNSTEQSAFIWVAREESALRKRFTIAHELGHLLLHPLGEMHRDEASFSGRPEEIQANQFAANLLMPLDMLDAHARRLRGNVSALADLFKVSESAMRIRLGKLTGLR